MPGRCSHLHPAPPHPPRDRRPPLRHHAAHNAEAGQRDVDGAIRRSHSSRSDAPAASRASIRVEADSGAELATAPSNKAAVDGRDAAGCVPLHCVANAPSSCACYGRQRPRHAATLLPACHLDYARVTARCDALRRCSASRRALWEKGRLQLPSTSAAHAPSLAMAGPERATDRSRMAARLQSRPREAPPCGRCRPLGATLPPPRGSRISAVRCESRRNNRHGSAPGSSTRAAHTSRALAPVSLLSSAKRGGGSCQRSRGGSWRRRRRGDGRPRGGRRSGSPLGDIAATPA
eukprot:357673-Chlamydomonas_euryale.AAC.5